MKRTYFLFILFLIIFAYPVSARAGNCFLCLQHLDSDDVYCSECNVRLSVLSKNSDENNLIKRVEISQKNYKRSLTDLLQFYLDTGNRLRLKNVSTELAALKKVPQLSVNNVETGSPEPGTSPWRTGMQNIEEANILFFDANSYRTSAIGPKGLRDYLNISADRYQMILKKYPESDKVADAAFYLGEIYSEPHLAAYEKSVNYYIKCYETDPTTNKPVLYNTAIIYDYKLFNFNKAVTYYELAAKYSSDEKHKKRAQRRLDVLMLDN